LDVPSKPAYQTVRVTYTRYRIDTIESPDDEHLNARNMQRIEINIHKREPCVKLVKYKPAYQTVRVTYTRYRIDTIESPDDEHLNA